jgi:hypothetical protein
MTVVALLGAKALYLLFIWLLSAIVASWLSDRKGYGEKPGLATGLLLTFVGVIVWLVWPAKDASRWKIQGPIPRRGGSDLTVAEAMAAKTDAGSGGGDAEGRADTSPPKPSDSAPPDSGSGTT